MTALRARRRSLYASQRAQQRRTQRDSCPLTYAAPSDPDRRRAFMAAMLLFSLEPTDRALTGWGEGQNAAIALGHLARGAERGE